jgi:hypothetical protein
VTENKLRVFTLVYGSPHLEWFKKTSVCLGWDENRKSLEGCVWRIYTLQECVEYIKETVKNLDLQVEYQAISQANANPRDGLHNCLTMEMSACVKNGSSLLVAPPDMIFGEGTIKTLVQIGTESRYTCVSFPHPRVNAETFPDINEPISNARLVSLAIEHLHCSWSSSNMNLNENSVYNSGVAWRKVGNLYAITSRIPTPHFVNPKKEDVDFMLTNASPGAWDHLWPEMLVKEQRQRVIGSSDAAFIVELTESRSHRPIVRPRLPQEPDAYGYKREHHKVNRNLVSIWRPE